MNQRRVEHELVVIAEDAPAAEIAEAGEDCVGPGAERRDVSQTYELVVTRTTRVGEHGLEGDLVAVKVRDEGDAHAPMLRRLLWGEIACSTPQFGARRCSDSAHFALRGTLHA
jgi:hypothetical protein